MADDKDKQAEQAAQRQREAQQADEAQRRSAARKPVEEGHFSADADPATAAEHQRAHDEGREDEYHARLDREKRDLRATRAGEPPLRPEVPTAGKMIETVPETNAPSADELRAMGREVKPAVEPTDVPTDRYPDKVELVGGKIPLRDHEGKRAPRDLYVAAQQGPLRLSRAEYDAMRKPDSGLEDWERAEVQQMLRRGEIKYHERER